MLILFLLIDTYIARDVRSFIEKQEFALFSFNLFPAVQIPYINAPAEWMAAEQDIEELALLGLESSRTFINMYSLIFIIFTSILFHLAILAFPNFSWRIYRFLQQKI